MQSYFISCPYFSSSCYALFHTLFLTLCVYLPSLSIFRSQFCTLVGDRVRLFFRDCTYKAKACVYECTREYEPVRYYCIWTIGLRFCFAPGRHQNKKSDKFEISSKPRVQASYPQKRSRTTWNGLKLPEIRWTFLKLPKTAWNSLKLSKIS